MKQWIVRALACALLVSLVAISGGCWGLKFFRMPSETLDTSTKVDSLLRENAMLRERISSLERALAEDQEFARGANAQRKMDLDELKDQLNALQEMLREAQESSPFRPAERSRAARPDTTRAQPKTPPGGHGGAGGASAANVAGHDTLVTASRSPAKDSLRGSGGAADTAGGLSAPVPPPEAVYRQIYLDYNRRQYQVALDESESFLAEYPDDPRGEEVLFIRGQCLMEQTAYMDALKEFSALLQQYPKGKRVPGALLRTAISYDAMGQKELAAGVARRLLKEYPQSEEAKAAEERFGAVLKQ